MTGRRVQVGGPFFEDFKVGQVFDDAPAVTLTTGHALLHQALSGDRLRLPLDAELSAAVTGRSEPLAHPLLVANVAIGQSTVPSQRVLGNLFYRGLVFLRPVHVGDTLHTTTEIFGLRQNRPRPGRPATGLVALRVRTQNQHGRTVLDFWRCPMIPLRDPAGDTGHADRFDDIPAELDAHAVAAAVPQDWRLDRFADRVPGAGWASPDVTAGTVYEIEGRDTVTGAPELARATLNLAATHTDPASGAHGRRLVYGGHTIAVAGAQVSRAFPDLVTHLAWRSCDHTGPVFEGDVLRTEVTVEGLQPLVTGRLVDLTVRVGADRGDGDDEQPVLVWRFCALLA